MTGEAAHSVSVAGVVIDENGRTLVIQRRDNGHWEPPGGVLERDESIIEGLLREVREETGLIVEPLALTGVYKNMRLGVVALVFRCRPAGGTLTEIRSRRIPLDTGIRGKHDNARSLRDPYSRCLPE